jgi:hypothetical protein
MLTTMPCSLEPAMNAPTLVRPLRLSRAWPWRVADDLTERLVAAVDSTHAAWQRLQCRWRDERELETAADLSEATLRDMGAPDWLQAQANTRREARRFERDLLGLERRAGEARYF